MHRYVVQKGESEVSQLSAIKLCGLEVKDLVYRLCLLRSGFIFSELHANDVVILSLHSAFDIFLIDFWDSRDPWLLGWFWI
ncbi:hypothetical protein KCV07_g442, partial [Aureobasidium melanogenum]